MEHFPEEPTGGEEVVITARVTDPDGVAAVILSYQLVDPGSYVRKSDDAYDSDWTDVVIVDDGASGDALAGDATFTTIMPAAMQSHRRLGSHPNGAWPVSMSWCRTVSTNSPG